MWVRVICVICVILSDLREVVSKEERGSRHQVATLLIAKFAYVFLMCCLCDAYVMPGVATCGVSGKVCGRK